MRRFFALWAAFLLSVSLYAQTRMVKGMVVGDNDAPLSGVEVFTRSGEKTTTGPDGKFSFSVSFHSRSVYVVYPDYLKAEKEIDGSFLLIRMRVDKEAVARKEKERIAKEERARQEAERLEAERLAAQRAAILAAAKAEKERLAAEEKARKEEEARLKAEVEAKAKAEKERLAAEEKARKEEEARLKAEAEAKAKAERAAILAAAKAEKERLAAEEKARKEEEARLKAEAEAKAKAEKERLAAEEKARKEEEARLKAEAEAKAKAEKERLAAEEKARKEEEARLKAEADAKARAERKAAHQAADKEYDKRFKNKGFEHSVDISYSYQLRQGNVAFVYSGFRNYGSTHPIELDYTLSYKFNRLVSVGLGVGVLYHLKSMSINGDDYIPAYASFREKQIDVPVFANVKIRMLRSHIRPLISVQGGYYCMTGVFYGEAGLGCEYRVTKGLALQLTASVRTCPWPNFSEESLFAKYEMSVSPCIKLGVSF